MILYVLESFHVDDEVNELEGIYSSRCKAEAKEEACRNTPFYGNCTFLITEEELDR